jgi:probable HAF family extracellular repeat protein
MTLGHRFALWTSTVLFLATLATAQEYSVTDLGTFTGGSVSQGQAVNNIGQVAGYARFVNFNAHGFLWTQTTGLIDLGSIPPATNFSVAQAINSFGDVVGYSDYNELLDTHGVRWSQGTFRDLGTLPGGTMSQANGVNDLGQIAGFSNGTGISPHAVLWSKKGRIQDLGTLSGGYYSQGLAINIQSEVAGFSNGVDGKWHGFVWSRSTGMRKLPMLSVKDSSASANGLNDQGGVVGGSGNFAVLWHNDGKHTAENLGVLTGQTWSTAFAINNLDQVVGWSGFVAFIWSPDKGMQDLNTLIPSNSGWSLSLPTSINLLGQITGQGTINGQQHGFLLTPVLQ